MVRLSRTAYDQPPVPASRRDAAVIAARTDAVARYPRWGFWKLHDRLRAEGRPWNHKRLHRVYCALRLNLPRRTTWGLGLGQLGYAAWSYLSKRNQGTSQVGVLRTFTIGADICFVPDPLVTPPASCGSDDAYGQKVDGVFSWHIGQSFSAIVPVFKSRTDCPDSGVDDRKPFRAMCDQRVQARNALVRAIACRHLFPFIARRCAEPVPGRARNEGSNLV